MDKLIYEIEQIVKECGIILINAQTEKMDIEQKDGIGNIVTKYDIKLQEILKDKLLDLIPDSIFIGEEESKHAKILERGYTFIVDPIDGTTNFSRGLYLSGISVALLKDAKPYISVCYIPNTNEMFMAQKGKGSYLNNKPIKVSDRKIKDAIVLSGSAPYYKELREKSLKLLQNFATVAADFRRLGSAVVELCYIACGKADIQFELKLQPWDYAAAMLIVEEAGGKVTTIDGRNLTFDKPTSILATNGNNDSSKYIDKEIIDYVKKIHNTKNQ